MTVVDLRSDTVTLPTPAMMEALVNAELGDDGRGDDPTVKRLEEMAALLMGKEAAVFVTSGTMGNLTAILAHTGRGGEVLAEASSHIFRSEMGGLSVVGGLFPRGLAGKRGALDLDSLADLLRPRQMTRTQLGTALVCLETTHNFAGGCVLPLAHMAQVQRLAGAKDVPVHLDGARIFNAAVALGIEARAIAVYADSVTFCLSKGLSAPVGSILAGSRAFVERARGVRRMLGGNLRQAGLLAACGIIALEQQVSRLAQDHANARALANGLHAINPELVDPESVETNIVMVRLAASREQAALWVKRLSDREILTAIAPDSMLRLVTHRHIGFAEVERTIAAFAAIERERRSSFSAA